MSQAIQYVKLPSGVTLEAELSDPLPVPRGCDDGNKLAVCLHPWSWLGGQMDDPILLSLVEPLQKRNYHILRFNSRGVGKSTGWSSFTGFKEVADLEAMVRWGLQTVPNVRSLAVIGYSHGSLIASLHPILPAPIKTSHVLISYPLSPQGWLTLFHTSTYTSRLKELVHESAANVLVLYGGRDEFTAGEKYDAWSNELEHEAAGMGNLNVVKFENATHFWSGRERQELCQVIGEWLP